MDNSTFKFYILLFLYIIIIVTKYRKIAYSMLVEKSFQLYFTIFLDNGLALKL